MGQLTVQNQTIGAAVGAAIELASADVESNLTASALKKSETSARVTGDVETDVLLQLKANLTQLENMHGRMKFMMSELSYLLLRRS